MRKVNIPEFRKEVLAIIEANRDKITSFKSEDENSLITFCGKNYTCVVTLTDKWIGYDLEITTKKGDQNCGLTNDTDLYPVDGDRYEKFALDVYDDLLLTMKAIFSGHIYYTSNDTFSYTAKKNEDETYTVIFMEAKKFLFIPYGSGWKKLEYSKTDFEKLKLKVLE